MNNRDRSLDRIRKILIREGEVRLTNLERQVLLELLKELPKEKRGPGRPKNNSAKFFVRFAVEGYVADLENEGMLTKAAVSLAMEKFGLSRSSICALKNPRSRWPRPWVPGPDECEPDE